VTHLACKAQDAVPQIHELAGERGIELLVSGELELQRRVKRPSECGMWFEGSCRHGRAIL